MVHHAAEKAEYSQIDHDIECKVKALKTSWVLRLLKNILHKILDSYCKEINIDVIYALQFSGKISKECENHQCFINKCYAHSMNVSLKTKKIFHHIK